MRFSVLLALIVALAVSAYAFEALEGSVHELSYHLRVEAPRSEASVALHWNGTRSIVFEIPPLAGDDDLTGMRVPYRTMSGDSVIARGELTTSYSRERRPAISFVLRANGDAAAVEVGGVQADASVDVDFDCMNPVGVDYSAPENIKIVRHRLIVRMNPAPTYAAFASRNELAEYLKNSSDQMECEWVYLDSDTDDARAVPGGRYAFATVADGCGGYDIVYTAGAYYNEKSWQDMRIKGHLTATPYVGHFDLEWLDSAGRPAAEENYASFDSETGILSLVFPLLGSSMRFRRVVHAGVLP